MLRCGSHYCRRPCHRPGKCEDAETPCEQACGKAKKLCGHPCADPCHAPYPCREEKPCAQRVMITCACQHLKQEMRCLASKSGDGNARRTLSCDDECARLARNHQLAVALKIDVETHSDQHIPYGKETLEMYRDNVTWAAQQERALRIFAGNEAEKRLRLKPMPSQQRAFVHLLADDYGLDSESMDPEPHRHVALFKTPRFVSAPHRTLAQCVELRPTAPRPAAADAPPRLATATEPPYNALLFRAPRFGLTETELVDAIAPLVMAHGHSELRVHFLPSEEVLLQPASPPIAAHPAAAAAAAETQLRSLRAPLIKLLARHHFVSTSASSSTPQLHLCHVDASLNLLRHESEASGSGQGWSHVAAKAAAQPRSVADGAYPWLSSSRIGGGTIFSVLGHGSGVASSKKSKERVKEKRKEESVVVEDWQEAAEAEEGNEASQREAEENGARQKTVPDSQQTEQGPALEGQ
ncbi:MAG: FKBP12-associated protein [Thelocarpon superellum]|nr:MAG: FKBP12-associated protein [Thelocarpon superellum]